MVILLFTASFLLSLAVSYVISKLFRESVEGFLSRFFARHLSAVAAKYLQFVIVFVGVTSGTRIHRLQDYIDAPPGIGRNLPQSLPRRFGPFPSTTPWSISFTELCGCWSCSPSWHWRLSFTSAART